MLDGFVAKGENMICSVCNKKFRVRKDGNIRKHRNPQPEKVWSCWCPGSGKPPSNRLHATEYSA